MQKSSISINDFDYDLPQERIAKYPLAKRDSSKLLQYSEGNISSHNFFDLPELLPKNACLVFNNTKVIYARMLFKKATGAEIEVMCLAPAQNVAMENALAKTGNSSWFCMIGNAKKWKEGSLSLQQENITLTAKLAEKTEQGYVVAFEWTPKKVSFAEILVKFGNVPLPPYLGRPSEQSDKERYQTVYAKIKGSVAAPTAGLHFTPQVFEGLASKNISTEEVTLHVGAGTFLPVKASDIRDHEMHAEKITVNLGSLENLIDKPCIIPVGTTSMRTLESLYWLGIMCAKEEVDLANFYIPQWVAHQYKADGFSPNKALVKLVDKMREQGIEEIRGETQLMITPHYKAAFTDALITNFHQPKSTLLLLISSLVGQNWKQIYDFALTNDYRFLSYGDSSLLFNENKRI